jgi:hypothetical protein
MAKRGPKPGTPRNPNSGRKKGTPNKDTREIAERLAALGCDPIEGMARIAQGDSPCPECHSAGKQLYSMGIAGPYVDIDNGKPMTCAKCHGTGKEPIPAKLAGEMYRELAQYIAPKRKAVEMSGEVKTTLPVIPIPGAPPPPVPVA